MLTSRDLGLLYVNDEPDSAFESILPGYVSFHPVATLYDAEAFILRQRFNDRRYLIDLVFCDVNMQQDKTAHSNKIRWNVAPAGREMLCFGPLLVLPFLFSAPWCEFVNLSSYWTNENVRSNGYVLITLALVLTAAHRKHFTTLEAQEQIDSWSDRGELVQDMLIKSAIGRLRRKIFD